MKRRRCSIRATTLVMGNPVGRQRNAYCGKFYTSGATRVSAAGPECKTPGTGPGALVPGQAGLLAHALEVDFQVDGRRRRTQIVVHAEIRGLELDFPFKSATEATPGILAGTHLFDLEF